MKTWLRSALSVLALGLISVGCQDAAKPTPAPAPPAGEVAPKTAEPAAPASGSGLSGGVDVPPPVQPDTKPEGEKPAAEAEKPAAEADKPAEEKKAE